MVKVAGDNEKTIRMGCLLLTNGTVEKDIKIYAVIMHATFVFFL